MKVILCFKKFCGTDWQLTVKHCAEERVKHGVLREMCGHAEERVSLINLILLVCLTGTVSIDEHPYWSKTRCRHAGLCYICRPLKGNNKYGQRMTGLKGIKG